MSALVPQRTAKGKAWGLTEVGDNTAGFLPVWHKSKWAALRPKFSIFLGQIHPRICPGHEQRCRFKPSLLMTWFLMVCPLISSDSVAVLGWLRVRSVWGRKGRRWRSGWICRALTVWIESGTWPVCLAIIYLACKWANLW